MHDWTLVRETIFKVVLTALAPMVRDILYLYIMLFCRIGIILRVFYGLGTGAASPNSARPRKEWHRSLPNVLLAVKQQPTRSATIIGNMAEAKEAR